MQYFELLYSWASCVGLYVGMGLSNFERNNKIVWLLDYGMYFQIKYAQHGITAVISLSKSLLCFHGSSNNRGKLVFLQMKSSLCASSNYKNIHILDNYNDIPF